MSASHASSTRLFITGFLRSGTTLLDKILHQGPGSAIATQPAFGYLLGIKSSFLQSLGLPPRNYPLGTLFQETSYIPEQFADFLNEYAVEPTTFADALCLEDERSGLPAPVLESVRSLLSPLTLTAAMEETLQLWADLRKPKARLLGFKEVICEEFIPYFLSSGWKVILVIRDPRAVVASIFFGSGARYVNRRLTVLYVLRQWRKSAAFALRWQDHSGFLMLRYEDLVHHPKRTAVRLTVHLDHPLPSFGEAGGLLLDQRNLPWQGNSSFTLHEGVSPASVARHLELLPPEWRAYIEAICGPELAILGYLDSPAPVAAQLPRFTEPQPPDALGGMDLERCEDEEARTAERKRLHMIDNPTLPPPEEVVPWFIFDRTFHALRSHAANSQ